MTALSPGKQAPAIELPTLEGANFSLAAALQRGPALAAFFKAACPVCHLTFPFVERLSAAYAGSKVTVVGISQDEPDTAAAFHRHYSLTFPVATDTKGYPVSNAYGLTNVPTLFLIQPDGRIAFSVVGWLRAEMEAIGEQLARAAGVKPVPVVRPEEQMPDFKPG